jgi:hypothetical protein
MNEVGSHHGLVGSVTCDLPDNIKTKLHNISFAMLDLTEGFDEKVSHVLDQNKDVIKYAPDTFSRIARWKYGQHVCNFLSSIESHDHIGIIALSVTAPIYMLSSVYLTR